MRLLLIVLIFLSTLFGDNLEKMSLMQLFKNKYYSYICMHRWIYINKYEKKNEKLLSVVAYACLKKHFLTPALDLSKVLRITKAGRINATYIDTLFLIKLLIVRYIYDDYNISQLKIPDVEGSLLAKVFYLAQKQHPKVTENSFEVSDANNTYIVTFKQDINNIIITTLQNGKVIKKDKYW